MSTQLSVLAPSIPRPEVRQHNALINSSFSLNTLEWRAFMAVLARIHPQDEEFKEYFIPATELVGEDNGGSAYAQVKGLAKRLLNCLLYVELLGPDGERVSQPDYEYVSFITKARYLRQRGGLFLKVNPDFMPYLLQLTQRGNFTKSLAAEFKHLSSTYSFKLYWLLSEYRAFGTRTFMVEELRFRLGIRPDEYQGRFNNFKAKVLDKAQEELADTDLHFEVELLREAKTVRQIRFTFSASPLVVEPGVTSATKLPLVLPPNGSPQESWAVDLMLLGVSEAGCEVIRRHLAENQYPLAYLDYVVSVLSRPRKVKIRKPADYLYRCVTSKLLLDEFRRSQEAAALKPVPKAAGKKAPAKPAALAAVSPEVVCPLAEVRAMYDNPGPFARRVKQAATFEEHVRQVYLDQGFVQETRDGELMLVLRQQ